MVQAAVSIAPGASPRLHVPREAERGVLHQVLRRHLPAFLEATSGEEGRGVPSFVRRELRGFLRCGVLRHGFARLRCGACREEKLVPFSCKGRGFCPCCGGRRMAERAAHLVDEVFPRAPVRQWVLSLPYALRYRLAYDHELCRAVLKVYVRALLGFHRRRAHRLGVESGQSGSVTVIQRFGAGLRLNLHFHTTAIDGVFTPSPDGEGVVFTELPPPTDEEVVTLLKTVVRRIHRLLVRRGLIASEEDGAPSAPTDPATTEAPALATLQQASLRGLQALGAEAGQRVRRVRDPLHAHREHTRQRPMHARLDGFDLHAAVAVAADDREGLESLCRYIARPAVAQTSLELLDEDRVRVALRHPWRDGTTHLAPGRLPPVHSRRTTATAVGTAWAGGRYTLPPARAPRDRSESPTSTHARPDPGPEPVHRQGGRVPQRCYLPRCLLKRRGPSLPAVRLSSATSSSSAMSRAW